MSQVHRYITLHLIAESPEMLSMMTVAAQNNWGMSLEFFDFSQTKKGLFICWFKVPVEIYQERVLNGQT